MLQYRYIFILLCVLFLSSCGSLLDDKKDNDFAKNKALWQKQGIENYSFTYSKYCFCPGLQKPATIVVKADTIHAVIDPETNEPIRDPQTQELMRVKFPNSFQTINELFEVIGNAREKADKLNVEYNQKVGYPKSVEIDYIEEAVDDEVSYVLDDFRAQ